MGFGIPGYWRRTGSSLVCCILAGLRQFWRMALMTRGLTVVLVSLASWKSNLAASFPVGATQRMTPSESSCVLQNFHFAIELAGDRILRDLQVVMGLQVHPELRLHAKKLAEA